MTTSHLSRQFFDLKSLAKMEPDKILDEIEHAISYIPPVSINLNHKF